MGRNTEIAFENRDKYIALGLNIAYYRKRNGMTQEQLAERAGISRSYLGMIEAPNMISNVSLEVLFTLAKTLEVDVSKLMEFRE